VFIYILSLSYYKLLEQFVVRKDMDVNEYERLSNITLRHKLKEQCVERKDKNVNEHERLSNIFISISFLSTSCSFNLCLSVILDSLSCSFISISFLSTSCSFNLCLSVMLEGYGYKGTRETIQHYT
jgi:hypothetical protein